MMANGDISGGSATQIWRYVYSMFRLKLVSELMTDQLSILGQFIYTLFFKV